MIPLKDTTRDEVENAIEQYIIGKHGERDRYILRRKLIDGATAEVIAEEVELTPRHVYRILYKRYEQLIGKI